MVKRGEVLATEYNEYYANYIKNVAVNQDLLSALEEGLKKTSVFFEHLPSETFDYRYAAGKWTPKEILLHLIDTERVFNYRALRFARKDTTALPGFEQDDFVLHSRANERSMTSLIEEYKDTRKATISLYKNLATDSLSFVGKASGSPMSTRATGFIICGHELHHCQIITDLYM